MPRSSLRRNVITCWCETAPSFCEKIRCVICSKQFHLDCHKSFLNNKATWTCYLCCSEDSEITKASVVSDAISPGAPAFDHSTKYFNIDLPSNLAPIAACPAANIGKCQVETKCIEKRKQSLRNKNKSQSQKRTCSELKIKVKKCHIYEGVTLSSKHSGSTVDNAPHCQTKCTLLALPSSPSEPCNPLCNKENEEHILGEHDTGKSQEQYSLTSQKAVNLPKSSSAITGWVHKRKDSRKQAQKHVSTKDESVIIEKCPISCGQECVPARMRIAQTRMSNDKSRSSEWNDFGPGLLCLLCEDGCNVHLVFKVAEHTVLRIPLRPEADNIPIIRLQFPSLIIAVLCSQTVWTKHAFTFLQSQTSPALNSILFVINRVWNSQNSALNGLNTNFLHDPTSVCENVVNYIRSIQNRPQFRAYCNAIQAAIRGQSLFQ